MSRLEMESANFMQEPNWERKADRIRRYTTNSSSPCQHSLLRPRVKCMEQKTQQQKTRKVKNDGTILLNDAVESSVEKYGIE